MNAAPSIGEKVIDLYGAAYSRDLRVQLPALIELRKLRIANGLLNIERFGRSKQRSARLSQDRRMLREYEDHLAKLTGGAR